MTIALQLWFRICHQHGLRRERGTENEWGNQFVVYVNKVNLLGENLNVSNIRSSTDFSKDNGVEANTEKTKYIFKTLINQNVIHEEVKSRLNLKNACYRAVQKHLSSHLPSKNTKIKIYQIIILFVLYIGIKYGLSQ